MMKWMGFRLSTKIMTLLKHMIFDTVPEALILNRSYFSLQTHDTAHVIATYVHVYEKYLKSQDHLYCWKA